MILPTAADVVRVIGATFGSVIRPSLTGAAEKSAAATIAHLLRHVELRIENEGQILSDDIAQLHHLLTNLVTYLIGIGEATAAARIKAALIDETPPANPYPALAPIAAQAGRLRDTLDHSLHLLQNLGPAHAEMTDYQAIRAKIRRYLAEQLSKEDELISRAFAGHGPRR